MPRPGYKKKAKRKAKQGSLPKNKRRAPKKVKPQTNDAEAVAEELALQEYVDDDMDENNLGEEDFFETTIEGDNV